MSWTFLTVQDKEFNSDFIRYSRSKVLHGRPSANSPKKKLWKKQLNLLQIWKRAQKRSRKIKNRACPSLNVFLSDPKGCFNWRFWRVLLTVHMYGHRKSSCKKRQQTNRIRTRKMWSTNNLSAFLVVQVTTHWCCCAVSDAGQAKSLIYLVESSVRKETRKLLNKTKKTIQNIFTNVNTP